MTRCARGSSMAIRASRSSTLRARMRSRSRSPTPGSTSKNGCAPRRDAPSSSRRGWTHRAILLRNPGGASVLLVTFHHIVIDEWSLDGAPSVELGQLYDAELQGRRRARAHQLSTAAASNWLRRRPSATSATAGIESGLPSPARRPCGRGGTSIRVVAVAPRRARPREKAAVVAGGATPFELALSVFFVALHGMLPGRRLVVATPRTLLRRGPRGHRRLLPGRWCRSRWRYGAARPLARCSRRCVEPSRAREPRIRSGAAPVRCRVRLPPVAPGRPTTR